MKRTLAVIALSVVLAAGPGFSQENKEKKELDPYKLSVEELLTEIDKKQKELPPLEEKIRNEITLIQKSRQEVEGLRGKRTALKNKFSRHKIECNFQSSDPNLVAARKKACIEEGQKLEAEQTALNKSIRESSADEVEAVQRLKPVRYEYETKKNLVTAWMQVLKLRLTDDKFQQCRKKASLEEMHCCMSVIWDGKDPAICNRPL